MKLIIDIDEEDFNLIRDNIKSYSLADTLFGAVKDGIPYEERPQGEWQYTTHYARRYRICPFCKSEKEDDRSGGWFYCWHCGADMRGGIDNAPAVAINKDFYKTDKSNPINRSDLFQ